MDAERVAYYLTGKIEVLKVIRDKFLNGSSRRSLNFWATGELKKIEELKNADNTKESKTEVGERTETKPE